MVNPEVIRHGRYVPPKVLNNEFFTRANPHQSYLGHDKDGNPVFAQDLVELDNAKILKITGGIRERRCAAPDERGVDLVKKAFDTTDFDPLDLGGIIVSTVTHDNALSFPAVACRIQEYLDARNVNFTQDMLAPEGGGFSCALSHARSRVKETRMSHLVVGLPVLSEIVPYEKIRSNPFAMADEVRVILPDLTVVSYDPDFPAETLEGIIVGNTSDRNGSVASLEIQKKIGASNAVYLEDVAAACSGFTHALDRGARIVAETGKNVLVAGVETLTKIVSYREGCRPGDPLNSLRGEEPGDVNADLFGDGCGFVILGPTENSRKGILATEFRSDVFAPNEGDMRGVDLIYLDKQGFLRMPGGSQVRKRAVRGMIDLAHKVVGKAGLTKDDVSLYCPHQFNGDGLASLARRIDPRPNIVYVNIQVTANMSSATGAYAFSEAQDSPYGDNKRVGEGDLVVLMDIGAGLAGGAVAVRL